MFEVFSLGHADGGIIIKNKNQLLIIFSGKVLDSSQSQSLESFRRSQRGSALIKLNMVINYNCEPVNKLKDCIQELKKQFEKELQQGNKNVFVSALDRKHDGTGVPVIKELQALTPLIQRYYNDEQPEKNNIAKVDIINKIPTVIAVHLGLKPSDIFTGVWTMTEEKIS